MIYLRSASPGVRRTGRIRILSPPSMGFTPTQKTTRNEKKEEDED